MKGVKMWTRILASLVLYALPWWWAYLWFYPKTSGTIPVGVIVGHTYF